MLQILESAECGTRSGEKEIETLPPRSAFCTPRFFPFPLSLAFWFCLALLPFAATFITFHPDERHYTDAAAQMVASGDYLTPRTPQGHLRFNKPVATYWLLVPGYKLLGHTPLAGRIAFLLLSAAVVLMTYRAALLVTANERSALLAAAIMASHPPLLSIAVSSIPDVPLTLCWLLGAYGWLGLVVLGRRDAVFYWAAYGSAGLGLAIKGLPILLLMAFAVAFARWNPWRRTALLDLVHLPSMVSAAVVGLAWYVAMYVQHGNESLAMFMSDQVTQRVGLSPLLVLKNLVLVLVSYALALLPWTLPLLRTNAVGPTNLSRITVAFILGWAILMAVVIAVVERFAFRYVLAATPLLAILVADRLASLDPVRLQVWWRRSGYAIAASIVILASVMVLLRWQLSDDLVPLIVGLLLASGGLWLCSAKSTWFSDPALRLTLATLTLFPLGYLTLAPVVLPDSGQLTAEKLRGSPWLGHASFAYVGNPALASKARVLIQGDMRLVALSDKEDLAIPEYKALLLRTSDLDILPPLNYRVVERFHAGTGKIDPVDALRAYVNGELRDYLRLAREEFVIVERGIPRDEMSTSHSFPSGSLVGTGME